MRCEACGKQASNGTLCSVVGLPHVAGRADFAGSFVSHMLHTWDTRRWEAERQWEFKEMCFQPKCDNGDRWNPVGVIAGGDGGRSPVLLWGRLKASAPPAKIPEGEAVTRLEERLVLEPDHAYYRSVQAMVKAMKSMCP